MAALIGYLQGSRGRVSRLGGKDSGVQARLETWRGGVTVELDADGHYRIYESKDSKTGRGALVHEGRVDS